jgi:hypothetical protein
LEACPDEVFEQSHYELGVLADDAHVAGSLDGDGLVVVAALVEADHCLSLQVEPDRELALAAVSFPLHTALHEVGELQGRELLALAQQPVHFGVAEVLFVVVLNHSGQVSLLPLDLLIVGQGVQWLDDVLDARLPYLCLLLGRGNHLPLLVCALALLDRQEFLLGHLHALLKCLRLDALVLSELSVELFDCDWAGEPDDEEGLIPQFEKMRGFGMLAEVLAEVFVAGLGVEELLNAPNADLVSGVLARHLLLQLLKVAALSLYRIFHTNNIPDYNPPAL